MIRGLIQNIITGILEFALAVCSVAKQNSNTNYCHYKLSKQFFTSNSLKPVNMQHHTDIFLRAVPGFIILTIAEIIFLVREHRFDKHSKDLPVSTVIGLGFITISFFSK